MVRLTKPGPRTPATSPGAKPTSWPCGTAPASGRPTTWFTVELANLRTAFRWAADQGDLDVAAAIATYAAWLGLWVEQYEPIAWAEELIEPARAVDHPGLAFLYVVASQCWLPGRIEAAVGYTDAAQTLIANGGEVPFGLEAGLGGVYLVIGQPERMDRVVPRPARTESGHPYTHPGIPGLRTDARRSG